MDAVSCQRRMATKPMSARPISQASPANVDHSARPLASDDQPRVTRLLAAAPSSTSARGGRKRDAMRGPTRELTRDVILVHTSLAGVVSTGTARRLDTGLAGPVAVGRSGTAIGVVQVSATTNLAAAHHQRSVRVDGE